MVNFMRNGVYLKVNPSNSIKSDVDNILTDDCFLNLGSLDQIGQSSFNASANTGISLSCINSLACDLNISKDVLGTISMNFDSSDNALLNCEEVNFEYFNISDLLFFNSLITYSGVYSEIPSSSTLTIINLTGLSLKKDSKILESTTNCIFYQPSCLYFFQTPSLILSPSFKQSSSVNSEFSKSLSSFFNTKALLTFSDKNCLTASDQFNSGMESMLCFNSCGMDNVIFGIFEPPVSYVYVVDDVIYKDFGIENKKEEKRR